jgi:hypothetical protein
MKQWGINARDVKNQGYHGKAWAIVLRALKGCKAFSFDNRKSERKSLTEKEGRDAPADFPKS